MSFPSLHGEGERRSRKWSSLSYAPHPVNRKSNTNFMTSLCVVPYCLPHASTGPHSKPKRQLEEVLSSTPTPATKGETEVQRRKVSSLNLPISKGPEPRVEAVTSDSPGPGTALPTAPAPQTPRGDGDVSAACVKGANCPSQGGLATTMSEWKNSEGYVCIWMIPR